MVLLHGIPTWSNLWTPVLGRLTRSARVLAPDLVGFGFSDKRDRFDRSIARQAELIDAWMGRIGVPSAVIVGHGDRAGARRPVGTPDDGQITVYNENLPLQTHVTQQRNDSRVAQRSNVFEVTATKRYSNRWMLLAGYTWSNVEVERTSVVDPNAALVNAAGRSGGREHQFKMTGSYDLPWGVIFGGNFRLESGPFITRTVQISGLNQGTITVNAEPRGSVTLDPLPTLDLRLGKVFRTGRNAFEVNVDAFNVTNENTVFNVRTGSNLQTVRVAGSGETRVTRSFSHQLAFLDHASCG